MTERNTMAGGRIDDNAMQWKQGCICLKAKGAEGLDNDGTSSVGLGAGAPTMEPMVAAAELVGMTLAEADELYWLIDLEAEGIDIDPSKDLLAEVVCVHTGGAADTGLEATVTVKGVSAIEAITDGKVTPDGSYQWSTVDCGAVDAAVIFPKAPLNVAGAFATYDADGFETARDRFLLVSFTYDTNGTAADDELFLRSVNLYYTRECCDQYGIRQVT
jgi:hypothetical protein